VNAGCIVIAYAPLPASVVELELFAEVDGLLELDEPEVDVSDWLDVLSPQVNELELSLGLVVLRVLSDVVDPELGVVLDVEKRSVEELEELDPLVLDSLVVD